MNIMDEFHPLEDGVQCSHPSHIVNEIMFLNFYLLGLLAMDCF
jgi:hypothetical protein